MTCGRSIFIPSRGEQDYFLCCCIFCACVCECVCECVWVCLGVFGCVWMHVCVLDLSLFMYHGCGLMTWFHCLLCFCLLPVAL